MTAKRARPRALPALGLDVGGVLVDRVAEQSDTSFFGDRPMDTPAVAGALEALPHLLELFEGRVYIVSKAGPKISALTRQWLGRHGAVGADAIPSEHLHFVRKRPEKAPICARLGVTHFVDDRVDVLTALTTVEHRYLFTGGLGHHDPPTHPPGWATVVDSWAALVERLEGDLAHAPAP